eukprot:comp17486_c0_seq1/m.16987 comp17486_c0_seq1/g.16987  ORF comp17486_c0_seq1/g.16987 comp17486_c0_seq1/m.16987 type:complete len:339 (-) comp17486_c0_seq1:182-1198(-)
MADNTAKIQKQVLFYFSDANVVKDKFLKEQIGKNDEGWVDLDVIYSFNRVKQLAPTKEDFVDALKSIESDQVQLDEEFKRIRRTNPIPGEYDDRARSIYAKGFSKGVTLEQLEEFFSQHCTPKVIRQRRFPNGKDFKDSVFVELGSEEEAQELAKKEKLTYEGTDIKLEMKSDYLARKAEEYKERVAARTAKKEEKKKSVVTREGCVITVTGLSEEATRETLTEVFKAYGEVDYIMFQKGEETATILYKEANAKEAAEKYAADKPEVAGKVVEVKALEGAEETAAWEKLHSKWNSNKHQQGRGRGRGGRGGRGGNRGQKRGRNEEGDNGNNKRGKQDE